MIDHQACIVQTHKPELNGLHMFLLMYPILESAIIISILSILLIDAFLTVKGLPISDISEVNIKLVKTHLIIIVIYLSIRLYFIGYKAPYVYYDFLYEDNFILSVSLVIMLVILVIVDTVNRLAVSSTAPADADTRLFPLYPVLFMCLGLFSLLALKSLDLLILLLNLEVVNIIIYALLCITKNPSIRVARAGLEFFVLSSAASGVSFLGSLLIYTSFGTVNISTILYNTEFIATDYVFLSGSFSLICGLLFKFGLIPFHTWIETVYKNCSLVGLLTMSVVPKIVTIVLICTTLHYTIILFYDYLLIILVGSIMYCGLLAIRETNIRVLFGYSSIIQVAYLLCGLMPCNARATAAVLYGLVVYTVTILMVFIVLIVLESYQGLATIKNIYDLRSVYKRDVHLAIILVVLLTSLAGLPPMPGFYAKYYILLELISMDRFALVFALVALNTVTVFYYARLISLIVDTHPLAVEYVTARKPLLGVLILLAVLLAIFFINHYALYERILVWLLTCFRS
jgi:NADH-quinone oxidoreductase subunit N